MTVMRSATLGFALALGASGAQTHAVAQTVVSRSTTTVVDESVGAAPTTRTTTRQIVHHAPRATRERTVTHTVRSTRRVATARPLALAPTQRRVIYRTLVQEQVVPQVVARPAPVVPGYPPFPAPAYPTRTVVVAPVATTGYALPAPAEPVDDDLYAEEAAPVYAAPAPVYSVGAVLPATVAVTPLPASATVAVPAVDRYGYATVDNRVLLVDPASNTVVADITP